MRFGTIQEMKIADVHAHVFPEKLAVKAAGSIGQFYGTEMYCEASMERLVAEEEKAGVSRYVISSSAVVPKQVRSIVEFLAEARKGIRSASPSARSIRAWTAMTRCWTSCNRWVCGG